MPGSSGPVVPGSVFKMKGFRQLSFASQIQNVEQATSPRQERENLNGGISLLLFDVFPSWLQLCELIFALHLDRFFSDVYRDCRRRIEIQQILTELHAVFNPVR